VGLIKTEHDVKVLLKRVDALESLVKALQKDLSETNGEAEASPAPGLKHPAFPRALRELGFEPPPIGDSQDECPI